MTPLFKDIRNTPLLWLLTLVPVVLAAQALRPEAHTLLFILSVVAIIPLAALLSRATEAVASRTGDMIGGLLNATLGNLTELLIALAALRAGQYVLVKASIAGAMSTNTLFMLGASFLLGGLKHHVQDYNRGSARLQAGLLFLATIAILVPSVMTETEAGPDSAAFTQTLSASLAVLLIVTYGLGLLFSLRTHRELFAGADHAEGEDEQWSMGLALATLGIVTVLVALVSEIFVESSPAGGQRAGAFAGLRRISLSSRSWEALPKWLRLFRRPARTGSISASGSRWGARLRLPFFVAPVLVLLEIRDRPVADEPAVLAWRSGHDTYREHDSLAGDEHGPLGLVYRVPRHCRVSDICLDAVSAAAAGILTGAAPRVRIDGGHDATAIPVRWGCQCGEHRHPRAGDGDRRAGRAKSEHARYITPFRAPDRSDDPDRAGADRHARA